MSHFAYIQKNISDKYYTVTNVIVAEQEYIDSGNCGDPANWVRTSYNGNIRNIYAGIGYLYDKDLDIFLPPRPFSSWTLREYDKETLDEDDNIITIKAYSWIAPIPSPNVFGDDTPFIWLEEEQKWIINPYWDDINKTWKAHVQK